MLAVAAIAFAPFMPIVAKMIVNLLKIDSRETARVWIENNLPPGARVYVEPYGPVYGYARALLLKGAGCSRASRLDWYVQNGFEYLVFSYGAYGRFLRKSRAIRRDRKNV